MKYSKETVAAIIKHIEVGNTQKDAAILENIGESTWQEWKHKHTELPERVKKAEASCKALHIANVRRHAFGLEGVAVRWTASAWWLERRFPAEFAQRWAGELSGQGGKPLIPETPQIDLSGFNVDELRKLLKIVQVSPQSPPPTTDGNGHNGG